MNKMFAVLKREYLQAVRKKSFIIMTFLLPFLLIAVMLLPALMIEKGMGEKRIAVLDGTGQLREAFARPNEQSKQDPKKQAQDALRGDRRPELPAQILVEYVDVAEKDLDTAAKPYLDRITRDSEAADKLEGVFTIPGAAIANVKTEMTYYSRSATDLVTQERMSRMANKSIQRLRLAANGMKPEAVENLMRDIPVDAVQLTRSGEKKKGGELNFLIAFIFGALLILPSFVYGQETMRGIVQEKADRVVEVLVSSMSPKQLLVGKILGVAAVGLTQIFVWLAMLGLAGAFGAVLVQEAMDVNLSQFIRPSVFVFFLLFFVLAYLTYVCVYAIAGAACNNEREAQQFVMPIILLMMTPWFVMMPIVMNPDAPFAIAFSLAPVFGPITMFVRTLVTEPPMWHVLLSIVTSIATILAFFWVTAKIFRVGILSYGKRPTIPEIWRWLKVA